MALDIFSTFDDHNKVTMGVYALIWAVPLFSVMTLLNIKPLLSNQSFLKLMSMKTIHELISRTQTINIGGANSIFITLIYILLFLNFTGMAPYIFSMTSHLAINLVLALPMWFAIIMMGSSYNFTLFMAHFQPSGSPSFLNPFLCIIELVSNMVRPITLSVRLTANLSTGHILMGLLGTAFTKSNILSSAIILAVGTFYFLFEMAVCAIQAYIFTLLPTLYTDEHPTKDHH